MPLKSNSNILTYFNHLAKGDVRGYPESTSPIAIDVGEYVEKCVSGEIDNVTHTQLLDMPNHPSHRKARLAEEFFTEQVIDSLAKQVLDPLTTKEEQATEEFTGVAG